jgi:alkanesulfonate monooxygenase SsuD/methylene tetrahydromethanopterin reductase-like flavin-dependent oxidoreductase (luciferase family)
VKVGILVTPGAESPAVVRRAEELGFASAWFVDSPIVFGDALVSMAAATSVTERIVLATGVTNPVLRTAPILASALASLNALAPGRIAMGIGTGFTATGALGLPPANMQSLHRFVGEVRTLLKGDVAEVELADGSLRQAAFINPTMPWVDVVHPIPVYVAAAGPRIIRSAAGYADAVLLGGITSPEIISACLRIVREGRMAEGLDPDDIEIAITPSVYLTPHDIDLDDEADFVELRESLGPKSLAPAMNFSRIAEAAPEVPSRISDALVAVRTAYRPAADDGDPATRHLRAYRGYMRELTAEQRSLVTREVLRATTLCGSATQCAAQLAELERAGIGHVVLSALPQHLTGTLEGFGAHVLPGLAATPTSAARS